MFIETRVYIYSLTLSAFRVLVLVAKLLVHILQLSARLVNRRHGHASGRQPQKVVGPKLVNLRKEAVESIKTKLDMFYPVIKGGTHEFSFSSTPKMRE